MYATFPRVLAFDNEENASATLGAIVFSCDYNGWVDVPEEEREGIDAFEASARGPVVPAALVLRHPTESLPEVPARKAA